MGIKLINLLTRIRILKEKNNEKYINKIKRICDNYMIGSEYIKEQCAYCDKYFSYHTGAETVPAGCHMGLCISPTALAEQVFGILSHFRL